MDADQKKARVAEVLRDAKDTGTSADPLVQIAWLIHGLDLWHRTGGRFGHTLEKTVEYVTSHILNLEDSHGRQ